MVNRIKDENGIWILVRDGEVLSRPKCENCHTRYRLESGSRPLCSACLHNPEVLLRFPLPEEMKKFAEKKGLGANVKRPKKPRTPTMAEPGSPEKMAVMHNRVLNGETLHHPRDLKISGMTIYVPWEVPEVKDNRPNKRR